MKRNATNKKTYEVWLGIRAKWEAPEGHDWAAYNVAVGNEIIGYEYTGFTLNKLNDAVRKANWYYNPITIIIERPTNKIVWAKEKESF